MDRVEPGLEKPLGLGIELRSRNLPRNAARIIDVFSLDKAAWIDNDVIRVDGGEHISGVTR